MANDKIYLELDELKAIVSGLETKAKRINEEYTNNCYSAIELGKSCIEISGLDISKIYEALNQTYKNITERCTALSSFITNNVIQNYSSVTNAISNKFNNQLGDKLNSLLGLSNNKKE